MNDDETIDRLLRDALAAPSPRLSSDFDARVMRRVRPRRLTSVGRAVLAAYAVLAVGLAAWLLRDLPPLAIVSALLALVPLAAGSAAYGRRLAEGR